MNKISIDDFAKKKKKVELAVGEILNVEKVAGMLMLLKLW